MYQMSAATEMLTRHPAKPCIKLVILGTIVAGDFQGFAQNVSIAQNCHYRKQILVWDSSMALKGIKSCVKAAKSPGIKTVMVLAC